MTSVLAGGESKPRIFGIGLSKTGTSSLAEALNILGIRTIHYPNDDVTFDELKTGTYKLSLLSHYQGVTDTPVVPFYPQLDRCWPGSKFILTVREKNSWLRSAESHWKTLKVTGRNASNARFQSFTDFINACVYGSVSFSAERFSYVYDLHLRNVSDYFSTRSDDLLVLDICSGTTGWEELCAFLKVDVPVGVAFPHAYRSDWGAAAKAKADFDSFAPGGERVTVVDYEGLRNYLSAFRSVMPFLELNGRYWGLPTDDDQAVRELERQRREAVVSFFVITSSASWFLDRFAGFAGYLRERYPQILVNERMQVFDVR